MIDEKLGQIAVDFWETTWQSEKRVLPYETRLLLSLTNAVGAGRMRQAARELVKAYIHGVESAALDDVFELLAWNQGIGFFSSEIGPSALFQAYKLIKNGEKQGKSRGGYLQRAAREIRGEEPGDAGLALKAENFTNSCAAARRTLFAARGFWAWFFFAGAFFLLPLPFAPIALFSANLRYISIKSPFLTRILTHSLYYGNRMQRVCPTNAALFRCGRGDSKNKQSLRQKRRRRTTTKIKEERTCTRRN